MFDLDHGETSGIGQALKPTSEQKDIPMRVYMMLIPYVALALLATCAPVPQASGAKLYAQNCAGCHGVSGRGDGPEAADLPYAPSDLTQIARRNGGVFPTGDVMAAIHGYEGREVHSLMPNFGAILDSAPALWVDETGQQIATPSALLALATYLEGLQDN